MFERVSFLLKKWRWQLSHEMRFRRNVGIILALIGGFACILGMAFYVASQTIHDRVADKLARLAEKTGVKIQVWDIDVGFFSVTVQGIDAEIGSSRAQIEELVLGLGVAGGGIKIDEINLNQVNARVLVEPAVSKLLALLPGLNGNAGPGTGGGELGGMLAPDARLSVSDATLVAVVQGRAIAFKGLSASLRLADAERSTFRAERVEIGPLPFLSEVSGTLEISDDGGLNVSVRHAGGDELRASVDRYFTRARVSGLIVSSSRYLMFLGGFAPGQVDSQNLEFELEARKVGPDDYQGHLRAKIGMLTVAHEKITSLPFELFGPGFEGDFRYGGQERELSITQGLLKLPPSEGAGKGPGSAAVAVPFGLSLQLSSEGRPSRAHLTVPVLKATCQSFIEILPREAIPMLKDFAFDGMISFGAEIEYDVAQRTVVSHRFSYDDFACRSRRFPKEFSKKALESTLTVTRNPRFSESVEIVIGPENPHFVPMGRIAGNLVKAVVASEDAAFFGHHGFDLGAIEEAFERNLSSGEFSFGGSTITMQTIKNLFLGSQKNIMRKVQEIFLAAHVETQVTKGRILEIYLNLAEFGPNIFGIGEAARIYFAKDPARLSLKESVFIASLLPAPVARFRQFCGGHVSYGYQGLLDTLLARMLRLGRIDDRSYAEASAERLAFNPDPKERRRCGANASRPRAAEGEPFEL